MEFDPDQIANEIATIKEMDKEVLTIIPNLVAALEPLSSLQSLRGIIKTLQNEMYDSLNADHEKKLDEIWNNLCPGIRRTGRLTSEWGEIGFQGKDPATDFRGMGALGLLNLHYFATNHTENAQKLLVNANTKYKYPFAITGINITSVLVQMLEKSALKNHFIYSGSTIQQFNELYVKIFIYFDNYYQSKKPVNIMQFGPIMKEFTNNKNKNENRLEITVSQFVNFQAQMV
eukprot:gene10057-12326_t